MSKRNDGGFRYATMEIAAACRERIAHHEERLAFWREEQSRAEEELRQHGIELREHPVTGGMQLRALLDPGRQSRVEECRGKVRQHEWDANGYRAYLAGVAHMPTGEMVTLDAEDIVYFGLVVERESA